METDRQLGAADPWLSSSEASAHLGVEVSTLAKWRQRGFGPRFSCSLRRDPRYRLSDLDGFMSSAMAENTTQARSLRRTRRHAALADGPPADRWRAR